MFISYPQHESPFFAGLDADGAKYWRSVQLSINAPWFVLTVEVPAEDLVLKHTFCLAWDSDLIEALTSLGQARPVGLLYMTPGRFSPTGLWSSREVREVWLARAGDMEQIVIFRDAQGQEFGDGFTTAAAHSLKNRQLLLKLDKFQGGSPEPAAPALRRRNRGKH